MSFFRDTCLLTIGDKNCKVYMKGVIFLKSVEEIRKELRYAVKFWHNLPDSTLEKYETDVAMQKRFSIVKEYNKHIKNAHHTLQKVYEYLYVEGLTQKDTAKYLDYSEKHVQRLNKQLILYFQSVME